jgi:hypothetical protein
MRETTAVEPAKVDWEPGAEMMLEQLPVPDQLRLRSSLENALRNPDQHDLKIIGTGSRGPLWVLRESPDFRVFIKKLHDRFVVVDMVRSEQLTFFQNGDAYEKALARRRATRP